eukprot:47702-Pleurochrysis_carterae.AAC.1
MQPAFRQTFIEPLIHGFTKDAVSIHAVDYHLMQTTCLDDFSSPARRYILDTIGSYNIPHSLKPRSSFNGYTDRDGVRGFWGEYLENFFERLKDAPYDFAFTGVLNYNDDVGLAVRATQSYTRAIMANSMDGEPPYGFESSWADISDDSSGQGAWEDYNEAKRKVYALIKDTHYEAVPDLAILNPALILAPVMAACYIPKYDWKWTCGMELRDTLKDCCVSTHAIFEWAVRCRPPPHIQEIVRDWGEH